MVMGSQRLLLVLCLLLLPARAAGQAGSLGVYANPSGTNCNVSDVSPGLLPIYIVHTGTSGVIGSEFSAPVPACMPATWLSDEGPAVSIGDSQNGISVAYGACLAAPVHVLTINLFAQGLTGPCCRYPVLAHPINGLNAVDCSQMKLVAVGARHMVNADGSCECGRDDEPSTWGKVKDAYKTP